MFRLDIAYEFQLTNFLLLNKRSSVQSSLTLKNDDVLI